MSRAVLAALLIVMGAATVAALMTWRQSADLYTDTNPITLPDRTAPEPPPAADPRAVPAHAASLPLLTFVVKTTWREPSGQRRTKQTVTRTPSRVHLARRMQRHFHHGLLEGGRREWLFVRNPVHPSRVFGELINHEARRILRHEESELRLALQLNGWADVLMMRFNPDLLRTLEDTGERREAAGATVVRFVARERDRNGVVEVWWSDALLLPLQWTVREAETVITATIEKLKKSTDAAALTDPAHRFPEYDQLDIADVSDRH